MYEHSEADECAGQRPASLVRRAWPGYVGPDCLQWGLGVRLERNRRTGCSNTVHLWGTYHVGLPPPCRLFLWMVGGWMASKPHCSWWTQKHDSVRRMGVRTSPYKKLSPQVHSWIAQAGDPLQKGKWPTERFPSSGFGMRITTGRPSMVVMLTVTAWVLDIVIQPHGSWRWGPGHCAEPACGQVLNTTEARKPKTQRKQCILEWDRQTPECSKPVTNFFNCYSLYKMHGWYVSSSVHFDSYIQSYRHQSIHRTLCLPGKFLHTPSNQ
jgi:hypothetical protein